MIVKEVFVIIVYWYVFKCVMLNKLLNFGIIIVVVNSKNEIRIL